MIREATSDDTQPIARFLSQNTATSMFLLGNLINHGVGHGTHAHSTRYLIFEDGAGITAVFGLTRNGFLMAQAPDGPSGAFAAAARMFDGQQMVGMTGITKQVDVMLSAAGLDNAAYALNHTEPLMRVALSDLAATPYALRNATEADLPMLQNWFLGYVADTRMATAERTPGVARERANAALRSGSLGLLLHDDVPVAMAGLNARAADHVQVGGVYVPPDLRNRGYGRAVTAAVLHRAKEGGARTGILFANNATAVATYRGIGFETIAQYRVALLAEPDVIRSTTCP